jgi:hypothetical protein
LFARQRGGGGRVRGRGSEGLLVVPFHGSPGLNIVLPVTPGLLWLQSRGSLFSGRACFYLSQASITGD